VKRFADLSEQEILALAISNEEEDSRIYRGFAEGLRAPYPSRPRSSTRWPTKRCATAHAVRSLPDEIRRIPAAHRRQDVKGFIQKKPLWLMQPLNLDEVRRYAESMEFEAARFYRAPRRRRATLRCASF